MKLSKSYQPKLSEAAMYELWEKSAAFKPHGDGPAYSLVVPPPNANGNLHMGHALAFALQDIAARYHRAKGEKVLFVPGADHAGFETQVVYERELEKRGNSRFDYSREELYEQIYGFVLGNRDNFETQIRRLGVSVDWTHYTFTLDQKIIDQAYATFRDMFDKGLIYRGKRLVNFCTYHGTAFADIEVVYDQEKGSLWQISYDVNGGGQITVATTRPETMLGDSAVAVNPKDKRYLKLIGKTAKVPLTNRDVPIIADDYVDPKFGTGAVKITPAHDPNDYDIGLRHDLPQINVIGFDGRLTHDVPTNFRGLSVSEGREAVVKALMAEGRLVKEEEYSHSVGHCYKCGTLIEPLLKDQWFIDVKPLAEPAIKALKSGQINFLPIAKLTQLISYLENLKDWNISRQIVWGIPIPAFQNKEDPDDWIIDENVNQEVIERNNKTYRRDPDVFDTWFSSSSWPYSTLNYPTGSDYREFYPLSLMETGFDILAPWVSRMIMLGLFVTGKVPFETVYLHGVLTDEHGQKMSKSKGNVINPLGVIEQFGSDALRIGMISGQTPGSNQPYVEAKVIGGRNFCNKLWNVARFIENLTPEFNQESFKTNSSADHWIIGRYNNALSSAIKLMDDYRFSEAYELIYHFIWDDLADWYIEYSKSRPNPKLLAELLKAVLVLVHPFAPFLSETIWHDLGIKGLVCGRKLIEFGKIDKTKAVSFEQLKQLIVSLRVVNRLIPLNQSYLFFKDDPMISENADFIKRMAEIKSVEEGDLSLGVKLAATKLNVRLDISKEQIDKYLEMLTQSEGREVETIKRLQSRLNNPAYVDKAPDALVEQTRQQIAAAKDTISTINEQKKLFG